MSDKDKSGEFADTRSDQRDHKHIHYPESFAGYPQTVSERRAEDAHNASLLAPRDALIMALRDLDEGKFMPDTLIVGMAAADGGAIDMTYFCASPNVHRTIGLLADLQNMMMRKRYDT